MNRTQILRRLGQAVLVLIVTYILAFLLLSALPSDAVMARFANPELGLSSAEIAAIREEYGADKPLIVQFLLTAGGFLKGNFGYSVQTGSAVSQMIAEALPGTVALAVVSFLLALVLALLIAVASWMPGAGWVRSLVHSVPSVMVSLPSFWVGIILIQVVSFSWGWVPVIEPTPVESLILPALTLALPISAPLAQVLLRSIEEIGVQPFVTVTRSRGASRWWLLSRTILRNALLPALTMAGLVFGELVGGAVVTEAVFGRQGVGQLTVEAVANRDTPVLLAVVLLAATAYVLINLLVDLLYPVLDPRLRRKAHS